MSSFSLLSLLHGSLTYYSQDEISVGLEMNACQFEGDSLRRLLEYAFTYCFDDGTSSHKQVSGLAFPTPLQHSSFSVLSTENSVYQAFKQIYKAVHHHINA